MKKKFYWRWKDGKYIKVKNTGARNSSIKYQLKVAKKILSKDRFWNELAKEDKENS